MSEIKFSVMATMFEYIQTSKTGPKKRSGIRKFLDTYFPNRSDYFSAIRLILPSLDRERGTYGLQETVLATCLVQALGMSRESPDAQRLINWRKGGPRSGAFAGHFSEIAAEVLQKRQGLASGGLTVKELNDLLDRLASAERSEKVGILSELIMKTNAKEMKWIIMIILKNLKLRGISEKAIFQEFHPDAEDFFNVTCDLKLVCETLRDRSQRQGRQEIKVGKAVRPQLAARANNAAIALKKLHGKEIIAECKFDGERIQIHKNGSDINFFSRNFLDHQEYDVMSLELRQNIAADRCILDGEMCVWDRSENRFVEFGANKEIAKLEKEGRNGDRQMCYVAFDILFVGDGSVIHRSLKERHQLLQGVVKPITKRLEILVPNGSLNANRSAGEPCWSLVVHDIGGIERYFKETIENRDEGIVLKDLSSKWEPDDRNGKWLKLKPDYVNAGSDLDVLIIGGYYGSGRHGGEVAQFLVGLAERVSPNAHPRRVGTGLSDEELKAVVAKLKPYLRKYEYPKKAPPSFYQVTNNSKERPDVWVESPEKSVIVSISSDIRTIKSEVYAAPHALRFPRIDRVRYDKPWHECLDVQSLVELVQSSNGTTQRATDSVTQDEKPKRRKLARGDKKKLTGVPSHFVQTDVSQVKGNTTIFSKMMFYFVNVPASHSLDSVHKMVVENGGAFSMNLNNAVTHSIASASKGIKFQAAKRHGDVIDWSWFFDCCSQKEFLPLLPKYFLFLSDETKKKLQEDIDEFSDSYYMDINTMDLKQMLGNIRKVEDSKKIEYYMKKFCPREEWTRFHGCRIYFHLPKQILENTRFKVPFELATRRMRIEVSSGGGSVAETLSGTTTHLVVVSDPLLNVDFSMLLDSFSGKEKHFLRSSKLQIVKSQWLEDIFQQNRKLPEEAYNLKPLGYEETLSGDSNEQDLTGEQHGVLDYGKNDISSSSHESEMKNKSTSDKPRVVDLPKRDVNRKRGRPSGRGSRKAQSLVNQPRRSRLRAGNKPAKISEYESDNDASSEDNTDFGVSSTNHGKTKGRSESNKLLRKRAPVRNRRAVISLNESGCAASSDENIAREDIEVGETNDVLMKEVEKESKGKETETEVTERGKHGQMFDEVSEIGPKSGSKMLHNEQVKDTVDPVQAMLLHMIPSLALAKTASTNTVPNEFKSSGGDYTRSHALDKTANTNLIPEEFTSRTGDSMPIEKNLPLDGDKPVKKKKVSYKEMANDLLKDW